MGWGVCEGDHDGRTCNSGILFYGKRGYISKPDTVKTM